ncbi:UDP-glucose 4-epimerase GalE [Bradyrhizobium sp. Ash2021]|uniref:UDP-glucose 4-epimerase GalE n=1 Tax=Bradyrhizobium sp. Ash2021 TaxID=2954771 RepID=UPI0028164D75|nr:UDP-glucose 4-epimerase GalE [Bradyrhizobium sp. Ash2021]WMT72916.1 UDP-glucose 4-epimerase GalE [Bradyrhizobium sp. Ash2021]
MSKSPAILVTGGAGYIGAHCCKALSEAGFVPVCFDNLSTGHRDFVKWGPFVEGDVGDTQRLTDAIAAHQVVAVMHFAAFSQVGESVGDPQKYYLNNVCGTLSLLKAMLERGCNRLVFSSTGAVYGNAGRDPISEGAAGAVVNPYGASKWMIEQILADYRRAYGMNSFCLRYFNACGAEPSGSIGEFRNPETHLIPRAMMALQGHVDDFAIFGDDYETPDGTAIRDYIHVVDLAAAHVRALNALLDGSRGGHYNLGTGSGFSVLEVLAAIERETGLKVPFVTKARRAGDPPILVADPSAAQADLGFLPTCSDLSTIVRSSWMWHQFAHPKS